MRFVVFMLCVCSAAGQSLYRIEPFAGTEYAGDGRAAIFAPLLQPQGIAVERDGSIVVADAADHRIRRITPAGIIHTVAGDGIAGFRGDGSPATGSRLQTPYGIAIGLNRRTLYCGSRELPGASHLGGRNDFDVRGRRGDRTGGYANPGDRGEAGSAS